MKESIKLCLLLLALTTIFCSKDEPTEPEQEAWKAVDMGRITFSDNDRVNCQLAFYDLQPDGQPRLYCLVNNLPHYSVLYEFNYLNNQWTKNRIDRDGQNVCAIATGNCRNDGMWRLYGISVNSIYEFNCTGTQWTAQEIYRISDFPANTYTHRDMTIGDIRNEGFESLYFFKIGEPDSLFELRFRNMSWEMQFIDALDIVEIATGKGRNDGKDYVYLTNSKTEVHEYRYANDSWQKSTLGQLLALEPNVVAYSIVNVLPAHNGENAVYVSTSRTGGEIFEFFFANNQWQKTRIGDEPGVMQMCSGSARNDGLERLYCSVCFDILAEYTYTSGAWQKTTELKTNATTSLNGLAVGPGRCDGINRIYVQQFIGHLFEFTFTK